MTGKRASSWTDGTASRAVARMKARLNRGWAIDSWAQTNLVPSCTPAAPISRYDTIASPRPIPPATNTGTSVRCGSTSCANTAVETGPIWPPASLPSMTIASAPARTSLRAIARAGAKQITRAPPSRRRWIAVVARNAAGEHDMPDAAGDAHLDQLARVAGAS